MLLECAALSLTALQPIGDPAGLTIVTFIAGAAIAGVIWYATRFVHRCTYIGEDGIALFELRGKRDAQPAMRVLVFKNASELRARQRKHFVNCIYDKTTYDFLWTQASGAEVFRLKGEYNGKSRAPQSGDAFHFAAASEVAWSIHFLARAQKQLENEGSIAFRMGANRWVRVGPDFMEFHLSDNPQPARLGRDEIRGATFGGGAVVFKYKGVRFPKWYLRLLHYDPNDLIGEYCIEYGELANGKVFLLALDTLMGYRWA